MNAIAIWVWILRCSKFKLLLTHLLPFSKTLLESTNWRQQAVSPLKLVAEWVRGQAGALYSATETWREALAVLEAPIPEVYTIPKGCPVRGHSP